MLTSLRTLVVDDDPNNVTSLNENFVFYLREDFNLALNLETKLRVEDALPVLAQPAEQFPLVVTDLIFVDTSGAMNTRGIEVVRRAAGLERVVVALTLGSIERFPELESQAREAGADIFKFRSALVGNDGQGWRRLAEETHEKLLAKSILDHVGFGGGRVQRIADDRGGSEELALVTQVMRAFPRFIAELNRRHAGRPGFEVLDEYDVQDALRAFLAVHFRDIRSEENTPSHAGVGSRIDLLLKHSGIAVEVKMARPGRAMSVLRAELADDKEAYRSHPDVRALVCFVYDPEFTLRNAVAFEGDLSESRPGFRVAVVVAPAR